MPTRLPHPPGALRTCAVNVSREEARRHQTHLRSAAPPSSSGTGQAGAGGYAPDAAGVGPVAGHARGQQQGRHGLIEKEVVVD